MQLQMFKNKHTTYISGDTLDIDLQKNLNNRSAL